MEERGFCDLQLKVDRDSHGREDTAVGREGVVAEVGNWLALWHLYSGIREEEVGSGLKPGQATLNNSSQPC